MLTDIHVKNLALIDELDIELDKGLNILTGETGAGKSIIIGSIGLALGGKMDKGFIRENAPFGLVELIFHIKNPKILAQLKAKEIYPEDGQLILTRKVLEGRSISKINGETVTLGQIREISPLLIDIHGQHEHQSLLYPKYQLGVLDAFGGEDSLVLLKEVSLAYKSYLKAKENFSSYSMDESQRQKEISFLEFEIREIEEANLSLEEDKNLEAKYKKMVNAKRLLENLYEVHSLCGYRQENSGGNLVGKGLLLMTPLHGLDEGAKNLYEMLADVDNLLNDFNRELATYLEDLEFSEEEFLECENRLNTINRLKAKYGNTIEEIDAYKEDSQNKLNVFYHYEEEKEQAKKTLEEVILVYRQAAKKLSLLRQKKAKDLESKVIEALKELNFEDTRFEIAFKEEKTFREDGSDSVEYLISTNAGEKLKALQKVVSGGELSRIMLALKTILADKDDRDTLIFDEIDTGISGRTAQMVSEKMAQIAKKRQVICITHLSQIAAMADGHFEISKEVKEGKTRSNIRRLKEEESIVELARILGGAQITETVLNSAKEMKLLADDKKKHL